MDQGHLWSFAEVGTLPCDARSTHGTFRKEWLEMMRRAEQMVFPFPGNWNAFEASNSVENGVDIIM